MKAYPILFFLAICLVGCNPGNTSSTSTKGSPTLAATKSVGTLFPKIIPTPLASKGTVTGTLVSSKPGGSLRGLALYFGTILPLTPGPDHLVNMDIVNSPKTLILEDGRFLAENITPGEYVLILWTPQITHFVPDPKNPDNEFIVKVEAGRIIDLGTMEAPPP